MRIAAAETMRSIDSYTINNLGIPGIVLMENAALKVISNMPSEYKKVCIVCSKGNNGGDGFAAARHLFVSGRQVDIFLLGSIDSMSGDCRTNYQAAKNIGINIKKIDTREDLEMLKNSVIGSDIVVDAIFGTGLARNVQGIYSEVIEIINSNKSFTLSIDVPSGMDSDTGKVLGSCIKADMTVTLQLYKKGFLDYQADKYTGQVVVEDIGIPELSVDKFHCGEFLVDKNMVQALIKERNKYSHKGDFGRVLIISGSMGYTGAAFISTQSAVRTGAGLVTLCCPEDIRNIMCLKLTEAMTCSLDEEEKLNELIEKADSIAIGPGMGNGSLTLGILEKVLSKAACTVVIDADGINVLKDHMDILEKSSCSVVITPHPGELSRITGYTSDYIVQNRTNAALEFARKYNVILLLKGYRTIVTDGKSLYVNSSGNSAMASGGMGDSLTGIIASLAGQGYNALSAAYIGAFIHGYAGDRLSEKMSCVNAAPLVDFLPYAIKELQQK